MVSERQVGAARVLLPVLLAFALAAWAPGCTPTRGENAREDPAGWGGGVRGPVGRIGGAGSRLGGIAAVVVAPTSAASAPAAYGENEEAGESDGDECIVPATALRLTSAQVEVDDPTSDGARRVHFICWLVNPDGTRYRETRDGLVRDRPDGRRSFRWVGPARLEAVARGETISGPSSGTPP